MNRMIVFCHLLNDNSGSPIVLRESIRALTTENQETVLFVGSQGRGSLETAGVPIQKYWYKRSRFKILTLFTYFTSQIILYRTLSKAKLGNKKNELLVYVNTLLPFGAAIWAHRHGHRVVYHIHEVSISPPALQRFLVNIVNKTAVGALYVSNDNRDRLQVQNMPMKVVPNPISKRVADIGFNTPYTPRRSGDFIALMLCSPRDFKGIPELLKLARSSIDRKDIKFILVLNSDELEISKYFANRNIPSNLEYYSRTDAPEKYYENADVLLNLSRVDQWIETFGLTIVEGMSFGLPVIAPPIGGPTEIITQNHDGFLIDSRDSKALKSGVLSLADSPTLAKTMSANARSRALDFSVERFSQVLREQIDFLYHSHNKNGNTL